MIRLCCGRRLFNRRRWFEEKCYAVQPNQCFPVLVLFQVFLVLDFLTCLRETVVGAELINPFKIPVASNVISAFHPKILFLVCRQQAQQAMEYYDVENDFNSNDPTHRDGQHQRPPLGVPPLHSDDPSYGIRRGMQQSKPKPPASASGKSTPLENRPGRSLRPRSGGFQDIEDRVMTPRSAKINDEVRFAARPAAYAVSSEERPALSADNNDAKTKERVKRVKKDKLELYQKLHDATKEREHYVAERHRMLQNANMINFQGGGQNNVEKPIANWQELLTEHRIIEAAVRDGEIDEAEAQKINSLSALSQKERGRLMKHLFEKYGGGFQYDEKTGRVMSSASGGQTSGLQASVPDQYFVAPEEEHQHAPIGAQSRSSSRGSNQSNTSRREWPDIRARSSKPGSQDGGESDGSSSRATTPDHFEDDGGRHDDLRKQIRGIGEKIKSEWDEHRNLVHATKKDRSANHLPTGATSERNQYKLLITPRNRNFLSQLGLKPEIAKHLPATRIGIDKMYTKLDRIGVGFIPTSRLYEHFRTTGMKISESDANRLVQLCDTNSDGYVQKPDLINALQKLQPMIGTDMCKPSLVARKQAMVNDVMREAEVDLQRRAVGEQPEGPQEVLDTIFAPKVGNRNISRDIGKKHQQSNVIEASRETSAYATPEDRFMTAATEMSFQSNHGYLTPQQMARLRASKQYFVKLDMMQDRIGALEFRARESDARHDGHETARINCKRKQLERYTRANLVGADLYDRMETKHRNRLRVMSKSPHLLQTFDIFNRGDPSRLNERLAKIDAGRIPDSSRYEHD